MTAARFPAGQAPAVWTPGQLIATRCLAKWWTRQGIIDAAIRLGQRIHARRVPAEQLAAYRAGCAFSHIACVVSADGGLVEMLGEGATRTHADRYRPQAYTVLDPPYPSEDARAGAVAYWVWLADHSVRYGYWTIVADALSLVTGLRVGLSVDDRPVCSQAAAAGVGLPEWRTNPAGITPAAVAARFAR